MCKRNMENVEGKAFSKNIQLSIMCLCYLLLTFKGEIKLLKRVNEAKIRNVNERSLQMQEDVAYDYLKLWNKCDASAQSKFERKWKTDKKLSTYTKKKLKVSKLLMNFYTLITKTLCITWTGERSVSVDKSRYFVF